MLTNKSTCYARGTKELPAVNREYDTRAGKIKNLCFLLPEGPPFLYVKEKFLRGNAKYSTQASFKKQKLVKRRTLFAR